jgi:lipoprotein-anchoring transpeptidase ErfK/SrfK
MISSVLRGIGLTILTTVLLSSHLSYAQGESSRDNLLSLLSPSQMELRQEALETSLEKLLAEPLWKAEIDKIPVRPEYLRHKEALARKELLRKLFPGEEAFSRLKDNWKRLAALDSTKASLLTSGPALLGPTKGLECAGKMVGNPVALYNNFEIRVDVAKYTLELLASRNGGEKTRLFQCKTGLGSQEFPTPRGSYYIVQIYDDHPLWVPPKDRDWAYGQSPSRSVYGGHMMPFYVKKAQVDRKDDEPLVELEDISPQYQLQDTKTYRIHGTDQPWSVGSAQSHGCVRLLNKTVKQLADTLKMYVGTTVRGETENGTYINLARPVRLVLY